MKSIGLPIPIHYCCLILNNKHKKIIDAACLLVVLSLCSLDWHSWLFPRPGLCLSYLLKTHLRIEDRVWYSKKSIFGWISGIHDTSWETQRTLIDINSFLSGQSFSETNNVSGSTLRDCFEWRHTISNVIIHGEGKKGASRVVSCWACLYNALTSISFLQVWCIL